MHFVFAAADAVKSEGAQALIHQNKPIGKWMEPYIVNKREKKMLILDTGNRFLDVSTDRVKPYNQQNVFVSDNISNDHLIKQKKHDGLQLSHVEASTSNADNNSASVVDSNDAIV